VKTKKLLIILLIAVLLVVYYILGMDYRKQRDENEALASQITDTTQTMAQIPEPPDDLEQRLAEAQASLDTVKNSFPGKMSSTKIINTILKLAEECEVKAIPLITQPWKTGELSGHNYSVFRLNIAVTGTFAQMVSFLSKLETEGLQTLIVEDLSVTRVTELPGEEGAPEGTIPINASLDLAIYTQSTTTTK
jgi:Tfp pilus assembly protein PilO